MDAPRYLEGELLQSFQQGQIIDEEGLCRVMIPLERVKALKIEFFPNEHSQPNFQVYFNGEAANFTIDECQRIIGGLAEWDLNIRKWHSKNKEKLVRIWNSIHHTEWLASA